MLTRLNSIWLILLSFIGHSKPVTQEFIYCENLDSGSWYWLYDDQGNPVETEGVWQNLNTRYGFYIKSLEVTQLEWSELHEACHQKFGQQWQPHPATNWQDNWYLLHFMSEGQPYLSKGTTSVYRIYNSPIR